MKNQYDDLKNMVYDRYPTITDVQFRTIIDVYSAAKFLRNDVIFATKVAMGRAKSFVNPSPPITVVGIDVNEGQKLGIAYALRRMKGK